MIGQWTPVGILYLHSLVAFRTSFGQESFRRPVPALTREPRKFKAKERARVLSTR